MCAGGGRADGGGSLREKGGVTLDGEESRYTELEATYPLGRPAEIAEIADLTAFLASDRSAYTTGTIFSVDGGIASRRSIV